MANETAYKTLLDCWGAPDIVEGTDNSAKTIPIAFISTTFTFDADFFDEECLTRFLMMETEKENDGVAFLIEREEKLASLHGGIVLVDQNHCKGSRSLRWDLVPCRIKNGIMHAKITLLHWSNCIRLIIGSANLTESGYCINQEVFSCIDYYPDSDADLKIVNEVLVFLNELANEQCGDTVKARFAKLHGEIKSTLTKWNIVTRKYKNDEVSVQALFVSPRQKNALSRLREVWDSRFNSPPDWAFVTSPFFDAEKTANTPSLKIFEILQQRGPVEVAYNITAELVSVESNELVVNAPEFLKEITKPSQTICFYQVLETGINEKGKNVPRPLHLKTLWLSKEDVHLFQIGSSNFTSAALGLGKRTNYEANLVYTVSQSRNKKGYDLLCASDPDSKPLEDDLLHFKYRLNEDENNLETDYLELPLFFKEAVLRNVSDQFILELNFDLQAGTAPEGFKIWTGENDKKQHSAKSIYESAQWINERKNSIQLKWDTQLIPDYLFVSWPGADGKAYWPVVVENQITLPPVDALKNLPLEALLQILSSNKPLHRLLGMIERVLRNQKSNSQDEAILDPHQLVDTSRFLLQRTRRVSYAMRSLRERLEKPVFTIESLNWRLYGPIGVKSLLDAIVNEAKSEEEKRFLIAELALELSRVIPQQTEISITKEIVKAEIKKVVESMAGMISVDMEDSKTAVENYSAKALQKAIYEL
ncbi:phospholipase D-like domain-containing protein [Lacibacter sediminis]|uniref:PLD phosphodiesterase domain-containing protein n=1 Tax=Lacibacter sediminis TaxID=2760713 RepID=A0A7G5XFN7_9BACT|nr:hypothetical protein [Lacibacter sediminis]QNA44290.1 hypothetical protein H4075_19845 [Lacibacter sediminis]